MPQGIKTTNDYAKAIDGRLYELTPKTVFAALAVSYFINTDCKDINAALLEEWKILHQNGIIPQPPPNL